MFYGREGNDVTRFERRTKTGWSLDRVVDEKPELVCRVGNAILKCEQLGWLARLPRRSVRLRYLYSGISEIVRQRGRRLVVSCNSSQALRHEADQSRSMQAKT